MARQVDGFEDRLDRLGSGEHRAQFDSKVRSLITDSVETIPLRRTDGDEQVARLLSLMEDLAKRMDLLDRKNRTLSEEIRQHDRRERRRDRTIALVAVTVALGIGGWTILGTETPTVASIPGE